MNINSSNGLAVMTLHADLGLIHAPSCVTQTPLKRRSPTYERRLARRHARRLSANDEAAEASYILAGKTDNVCIEAEKPNNEIVAVDDKVEKPLMLKGAAAKLAFTEDISSMAVKPMPDEGATPCKVVDIHESSVAEQAVGSTLDLVDNGTD